MSVYAVYAPPLKRGKSAPDPERFVFVRDRFSFWAFLVPPLWMLRHRLWLAFVLYLIVIVALELALGAVGAPQAMRIAAAVLLSLLVGLEAATLRRRALARRGWSSVGIVVGDDVDAAERRFFDSWVAQLARNGTPRAPSPSVTSVPNLRRPPASDVTGLFPEPGAPR